MKKIFLIILLSFGLINSHAQYQQNSLYGTKFKRGAFDSTLFFPTGCGAPSGTISLKSVNLNMAAKYFDSCSGTEYTFNPKNQTWKVSGSTSLPWDSISGKPSNFPSTFQNNVTLNGPAGIRVGKYTNGQTIPAAGKTLDQFLTDIAIEAVAPTYVAPTAGIGSSPSGGSYEMGTNLGTITLSATFTQNNGGSSTGNTYAKYISSWNNLGSNTDAITSLTTTTYYRVTTSYNQGACLNNNLGAQDCTGRINAGSVTSGNVVFTPFQKRYWGFVNSPTPSDADILALTQDANGSTVGLSLSSITPTGSQYLVYVRPNSGSVSGITVNGFPSLSAFTTTTRSFVNAQGYSSSYQIIITNNPQTGTLDSVIFN